MNNFHIPENGHFNNRGNVQFPTLSNLAQGIYSYMVTLGGTLSPSQARYWGQKTFGFYIQDDYRVVPADLELGIPLRIWHDPHGAQGQQLADSRPRHSGWDQPDTRAG